VMKLVSLIQNIVLYITHKHGVIIFVGTYLLRVKTNIFFQHMKYIMKALGECSEYLFSKLYLKKVILLNIHSFILMVEQVYDAYLPNLRYFVRHIYDIRTVLFNIL